VEAEELRVDKSTKAMNTFDDICPKFTRIKELDVMREVLRVR